MKLGDELREIGLHRALAAWPATTAKLADLMRERSREEASWGSLLVELSTREVELLLIEWANDQGIEARETRSGLGGHQVLLVWGYTPIFAGNPDVAIRADGSLLIAKKP